MPIVGWYCPLHLVEVQFDHFERAACDAASPFLTHYEQRKIETDIRHSTLDTTVTQVQDCPRHIVIDRLLHYHADPTKLALLARGTAGHEATIPKLPTDSHLPYYYITEASDKLWSEVAGTLWGLPINGKFDAVLVRRGDADTRPAIVRIIDAKFPKDGSVRYRKGKNGIASAEHASQLNMLRLLLDQQDWVRDCFDYDPNTVEMGIWDHAIGSTEKPVYLRATRLDEEQIGNIRPWNSPYTIKEMAFFLAGVRADVKELNIDGGMTVADREAFAATLPLVGVAMGGESQWKCFGCGAKRACDALVAKYGRPE